MNVIICGAGEVGTHAAEQLSGAGHDITVVDSRPDRLRAIEELLDVRTLVGNGANADILREAGADDARVALVAATSSDEINLLIAAVGRGVGVGKTIARVHHSAYFDQRGLDYCRHLGIDRLICPEYSTAQAVASALRNPAALMIETFASGQIEVQEFPVAPNASAIGQALMELPLPHGFRLAAIRRGGSVFLPLATTVIEPEDVLIVVGNVDVFEQGRRLFRKAKRKRQRMVIMGGSSMGVWLCRVLREQPYSLRLFEPGRARAEELADKLEWATIVQTDPTDLTVFEEEHIAEADAFVGVSDDDEHNILACAWAKSEGVDEVIAIVQRAQYMPLMERVGIDHVFSPRRVAVKQIERSLDEAPLLRMACLAEGVLDVYRVRLRQGGTALGQPLRSVRLSPDWMVAALQRPGRTWVPTADDVFESGDTVMVIGRHGQEEKLRRIFGV